MSVSRRLLLLAPLAAGAFERAACAADGDPAAVATIQQFYDGLLAVMKVAKSLTFDQRYARLEPIIGRAFDLGLMTRIAVGPQWAQLQPGQQQRLLQAFARYTVSQWAGRFDGYAGERFEVDPTPAANPNGVVVRSKLVQPNGEITALNYLLRRGASGVWQVIDVYLSGTISELATRRSEFAGILQSSGADGLVRALDQRSAALRTG
jgi:phospholipid transport system substrate-binding protein